MISPFLVVGSYENAFVLITQNVITSELRRRCDAVHRDAVIETHCIERGDGRTTGDEAVGGSVGIECVA